MNFTSFSDEFLKLAAVSREEAEAALKRLKTLEETKPTGGQLARGAIAGAGAGTMASLANNVVSGNMMKGIKHYRGQGLSRGGLAKALGKAALRTAGGAVAGTTAFGATMPIFRGHLDRGAEVAKLKEYLGGSPESIPTALHHRVTKVVGV